MLPSNHSIAHSTPHVFSGMTGLFAVCLLFFTLDSHAMSQTPEDDAPPAEDTIAAPYVVPGWHENAVAENDAAYALKNGDTRLLGFALRSTSVPGIEGPAQKQAYIDQCGLRFFEDFGDVVRSDAHLQQMKQARDYAVAYNRVIMRECRLSE